MGVNSVSEGDTTHTYMGLARGVGAAVSLSPTVSDDRRHITQALHRVAILVSRRGRLRGTRMREVCTALAVAVDCSD
jgi:mRNA-degrading endonuclease toxin of MazEF toxin-antitoxin module